MKQTISLIILLALASLPMLAGDVVEILPFGYKTPWTGKTIFNSEGGYAYNNTNNPSDIHDWEKLYEAQTGDVYTISLPTATTLAANGRVQFKTPINLYSEHNYRFNFTINTTKALNGLEISMSECDNDNVILFDRSLDLNASVNKSLAYSDIKGVDIQDAKLELKIPTFDDDVMVSIKNLKLTDLTTGEELWTGTSYYNWCYYYSPSEQTRIKDMVITGRKETMSWTLPDFNDTMWDETMMPVGNNGYMDGVQTIWPGGDNTNYWIRRNFELNAVPRSSRFLLRVLHDDAYSIYVNGQLIDSDNGWTNGTGDVCIEVPASYLQLGKNVIATYIQQNWGGKFYDCALQREDNYYTGFDEDADVKQLQINEVQVANIDQYIDRSFNYGGWIEIYNPTDKTVPLDGLYLTDDETMPRKFIIPQGMPPLPPYGFQVIYFGHNAKDGTYGSTAKLQVDFKLENDGGSIFLLNTDGTIISSVDYPAGVARCSYARADDKEDAWGMTANVTPGKSNTGITLTDMRYAAPTVDTDSRIFSDAFQVKVDIPTGATLLYTTDGSAPTLTNSRKSDNGIFDIRKTTTLRLCLISDNALPSQVVTRTYIKRDQNYYLPVVAITTESDNLYGDSIGVYVDGVNGVDGRNHGKSNINMDWERPVNFEYLTANGKMAVNMEAAFTVSGGWSRHFAPTSFKIKASKLYEGKNSIDYPLFPLKPYNKYKQILIRNGGNDNDSQAHGRVRDAITQQVLMSSGVYVDAQDYQPVHVFFNGKYIGQLNLREPNNRYNGTANYGYDDDEMDAFEYSNGYFQMAGTKDAFSEWLNLTTKASNDATYEQIRERVDIDEYTNYWAAVSYIGCSDWICNNNNVKGYRSLPDGKFHLTVLDQDWGWNNSNGVALLEGKTYNELLRIYNYTKKNKQWQRQFINAYCMMAGSIFTPERCEAIGDSICNLVAPALALEGKQPYTSWNEQKGNMMNASPRDARMNALRTSYGLGNGMQATIGANITEASLMLDGQPIPLNKFNGTLFAPFDLEVSAPAGYNFLGWAKQGATAETLIQRSDNWSYYDKGALDGDSWKSGTNNDWSQGVAPLGYGKDAIATTISYGGNASQKYITYYFSKTFNLKSKPQADDTFTMNWTADDGFVIYVNGAEVARHLMPEGTPTYETYATTYAPDNPDNGSFDIPTSVLQKGENLIAVEVHNNVPGSSDIYWDAELICKMNANREFISNNRKLSITSDADMTVEAVFERLADDYLIPAGSTPIVINEVSASNSVFCNEYYKKQDWIELYNTTNEDINLAGMFLSDNPTKPEKYVITADNTDANTIIPAHGYKIIWADKVDPLHQLHAGFKLNNEDGACVMLTAADHAWADTLNYVTHTGVESVGRYPDGGKRVYHMTRPTINRSNVLTSYAQWLSGEDENFDVQAYLDYLDALQAPMAATQPISTEYFTLDGIRVSRPTRGIYIVRSTSQTGVVSSRKVIIK